MCCKWISGSVFAIGMLSVTACASDDALPSSPLAPRAALNASTLSAVNGSITFASFLSGNEEIYVMNADGSGQTNLTNNPASDGSPDWSPDGTKIAFASNRDGNLEIYVMNADGSGRTKLTNIPAVDTSPDWSPDGTKIAFASIRDGNPEIYVMNADGSGQTNLTNNPASDASPVWSPDGAKIAFESGNTPREIYVMNADGSGRTNLTNNPASDRYPAWSPDGMKIAFESTGDSNAEIYVMNSDGSGQTNLTNYPTGDNFPVWSPDGTKIAFTAFRNGMEIYVMNADGTGQTRFTNSPGYLTDWGPGSVADYTYSCIGLACNFDGRISAGATGFLWDFGDGTTGGIAVHPRTYASPGTYTVTLTTTPSGAQPVMSRTIVVDAPPLSVADYIYSCTGLACNFDGRISTSAIGFQWDFGDGTTGGVAVHPRTYASPGTYTVTLTTTPSGAQSVMSRTIVVGAPPPPPPGSVADYNYSCTGLACNFDGRISAGATGFRWDFGDGTTGGVAVHPRTYASPGTYTVTLTTTPSGAQSVMSKTIIVGAPPSA